MFQKLVKNLQEGASGAEQDLVMYVEEHYLNESEQLELIELLRDDNLRNAVTKILSAGAKKCCLCTKAHEELANKMKDSNHQVVSAAKEILMACIDGWGIWTEGLVILANQLKDTDFHIANDAKSVLLKQMRRWKICGKALSELILQKNDGSKAAAEVLEYWSPFEN